MRNFLSIIFVASLLISAPLSLDLNAQAGTQKNQNDDMKQKYRKARVLQTSTAKKITKVVEALERVNEEGKEDPDWVTVRAILNKNYFAPLSCNCALPFDILFTVQVYKIKPMQNAMSM